MTWPAARPVPSSPAVFCPGRPEHGVQGSWGSRHGESCRSWDSDALLPASPRISPGILVLGEGRCRTLEDVCSMPGGVQSVGTGSRCRTLKDVCSFPGGAQNVGTGSSIGARVCRG